MAQTELPDAAGQPKNKSKNALYVGDLDKDVDEGYLYQIFSKVRASWVTFSFSVCLFGVADWSRGVDSCVP